MKEFIKNISKKNILKCFFLIMILVFSGNVISTLGISNESYENKIKTIISKYGEEKIQFLDGVAIDLEEELDLNDYLINKIDEEILFINSEDEELVEVSGNLLKGKQIGTGFVSITTNNNVYILEVLISDSSKNYSVVENLSIVDRDYYAVFIDPGHGGQDPGAIANGVREADLNLSISKKIKTKLENKGIHVMMSRYGNETVSLSDRAIMSNNFGGDVFVSIHQNSFTSSNAYGIETYYHTNKSQHKSYADKIQRALINNTGAYNRGVKQANFAVLRETYIPSALVECGFITNINEVNNLKQDYYQEKIATAVSEAIYNYLIENIKLTEKKDAFNDIVGHWGQEAIERFVERGFLIGYSDGSFRPNIGINRAEFIKLVNRIFGYNEESDENFEDVEPGLWYYSEVRKAVNAGYINTENKTFRPNDMISREEAAVIITNIKKNKDENLDKIFNYSDYNDISIWAKTSVEGAIEAGYMGQNVTEFRPLAELTRAEAVVLLDRITN